MPSFPLHCNICPKHPTFSDISHLLTHVGSKGHLSHYFKAQVRSRQEPSVRRQLDIYDHWYEDNRIEKLLSLRMIEKDAKAAKARNRGANGRLSAAASFTNTAERVSPSQLRLKEENVLDPQLSRELFLPNHSINATDISPLSLATRHRAFVPRMSSQTSTIAGKQRPMLAAKLGNQYDGVNEQTLGDSDSIEEGRSVMDKPPRPVYPDPSMLFEPPSRSHVRSKSPQHPSSIRNTDAEEMEHEGRLDDEERGISESLKLKGILWPGMDMFDSASPDAKRRRNQKKDGSILEQMRMTSATVEPTEIIFNADGNLHKMRRITGQVESSPIKEVVTKPKRQRPSALKPVLSEISTNFPRAVRRVGNNKVSRQVKRSQLTALMKTSSRALAMDDCLSSMEPRQCGYFIKYKDIEWELTPDGQQSRSRKAFRIHDDRVFGKLGTAEQPQVDTFEYQKHSEHHPFLHGTFEYDVPNDTPINGMPYLTAAYCPPFATDPHVAETKFPNTESMYAYGVSQPAHNNHIRHPAQVDKENINPLVGHTGKVDGAAAQLDTRRVSQRYFTAQASGPTQFFDSFSPHIPFDSFKQPDMPGCTPNPLTFSFQQAFTERNLPTYQPNRRPFLRVASPSRQMTRPGGPESENDEDSGDETIEDESEGEDMLCEKLGV